MAMIYGRSGAEVARPYQGAERCGRVAPDRISGVGLDASRVRIPSPAKPETAYFETLQVDTDQHPAPRARRIGLWALWALAIALVGGHPFWTAAGMPVPAFLSPVMEIL